MKTFKFIKSGSNEEYFSHNEYIPHAKTITLLSVDRLCSPSYMVDSFTCKYSIDAVVKYAAYNISYEMLASISSESDLFSLVSHNIARYIADDIQCSEILFVDLAAEINSMFMKSKGHSTGPNVAFKFYLDGDTARPPEVRKLPGMHERVTCPVDICVTEHYTETTLYTLVQHLNDTHNWTRERIADWLDEQADAGKINIDFQPWSE